MIKPSRRHPRRGNSFARHEQTHARFGPPPLESSFLLASSSTLYGFLFSTGSWWRKGVSIVVPRFDWRGQEHHCWLVLFCLNVYNLREPDTRGRHEDIPV